MFGLDGKTAALTGAGRGIDLGIARAAILCLASEESGWVTGQLLPVNGGNMPA